MSEALAHIAEKLCRANKHIEQLEREIEAFLGEDANRIFPDLDSESAKAFQDSQANRAIPPRFSVITGEVIYHLRSSLDHLVCALVLHDGGTPSERTQFPIERFRADPTKRDEVRRYQRQIEGITRPEVLTAIEGHQPWKRENRRDGHWLAILKGFSNTDKHRSLVLHRVSVEPRINATVVSEDGFEIEVDRRLHYETTPESLFEPGDAEVQVMNVQRRFATSIAFDKWGDTSQTVEVVDGLRTLRQLVRDVVIEFTSFLP